MKQKQLSVPCLLSAGKWELNQRPGYWVRVKRSGEVQSLSPVPGHAFLYIAQSSSSDDIEETLGRLLLLLGGVGK